MDNDFKMSKAITNVLSHIKKQKVCKLRFYLKKMKNGRDEKTKLKYNLSSQAK